MRHRALGVLVLAGCGHGAVVSMEPLVPACRGLAVTPAGPAPDVRWYGPGQEDEAARHFRHCRAVGPSLLATAGRPAGPVDSLAIISYNMELGGGALGALLDSVAAGAYSGGRPVSDYLILVQEAFRAGAPVPVTVPKGAWTGRGAGGRPADGERADVVAIAARGGLHLYYSPAIRAGEASDSVGRPEDWGNAILSTVPLERPGLVELPYGGTRRIAQLATLRGRTSNAVPWRLELANVHFAVGPIGPSALSALRARQARAMVTVLEGLPAVVLGGDLNAFSLTGTAESVKILRRALGDGPGNDPGPTRGGQRLDYLFFRLPPGATAGPVVRLPSTFGSDHYPVLSWVRFAGRPDAD